MNRFSWLHSVVLIVMATGFSQAADKTAKDWLQEADAALKDGKTESALKAVDEAIKLDSKNAKTFLFRGVIHSRMEKHAKAIEDLNMALKLDPKLAQPYQIRGEEHFKSAHIKESIADFDEFLKLQPDENAKHWQRGISYYYAGRFEDGQKQFERYQDVDGNDVENVVWRFLCMAKKIGVEKARADLLKVGEDKRVPMMKIYDLFAGKAKPEDVLKETEAGPKPAAEEMKHRLFNAHLYLALYYEAEGDKKKSLVHIEKAVKGYKIPGYMWDVANVHWEIRKKEK